jgi:hypothetical protein
MPRYALTIRGRFEDVVVIEAASLEAAEKQAESFGHMDYEMSNDYFEVTDVECDDLCEVKGADNETPNELHTLVAPVWGAKIYCRPAISGKPLTHNPRQGEDWQWRYGNDGPYEAPHVAAERIEFGVDRLIESQLPFGFAYRVWQDMDGQWSVSADPLYFRDPDRLAAKIKLAKQLLGLDKENP